MRKKIEFELAKIATFSLKMSKEKINTYLKKYC